MKAFDAPTGLTYAQADANCQDYGGEMAAPFNPVDAANIYLAITNDTSLTSKNFWIG